MYSEKELFNVIPLDDADLAKYSHHFSEGDRVRIVAPFGDAKTAGHTGKIFSINARGLINVRLDSGHEVMCHPAELSPEDFPGEQPAPAMRAESALEEKLAAIIPGLRKEMTPHDATTVEACLSRIRAGTGLKDIFGLEESDDEKMIHLLISKYSGDGGSSQVDGFLKALAAGRVSPEHLQLAAEGLAKFRSDHDSAIFSVLCEVYKTGYESLRKGGLFEVGQSVKDIFGKVGVVKKVIAGVAYLVDFGGGLTGMCLAEILKAA